MVRAIVGGCWGDEGKGKMTDLLSEDSDIVVRFQGGANAGHTIINQYGKFALHLLPSGICRQDVTNVIAQGVAFGTASHAVGTSRAMELSQLTGAVSSLSLTVAGVITAVLFHFLIP